MTIDPGHGGSHGSGAAAGSGQRVLVLVLVLAPSCGAFNSGFNYREEGEHRQCLHSKSAGLSARNRKTKGIQQMMSGAKIVSFLTRKHISQ